MSRPTSIRPPRVGRASTRCRTRGVLLPLLALAMAGGGALWLAAAALPTLEDGRGDGMTARVPLLDARRALIAHASAYPEYYGPLGAGPGHLVCPDTDTSLDGRSVAPRANDAFGGDGPNPPCGGGPLAVGRLPRHVGLAGRRRAFHHEPSQRFVYAVATGYVNNPPGAALRRRPAPGARDADVVAVIVDVAGASLPPADLAAARDPLEWLGRVRAAVAREAGAGAARSLAHALVTRGELTDAAERRAAAWFVETATDAARRRAATRADDDVASDALLWPDAGCIGDGADAALRWIGDGRGIGDGRSGDCTTPPETIENTPRARHWFVREGWYRNLFVRRHPRCRTAGAGRCLLVVSHPARGARASGAATTAAGTTSEDAAARWHAAFALVPADGSSAPGRRPGTTAEGRSR